MSDEPRAQRGLLRLLLAVSSLGLVAILMPFHGTLLWALVVALLFTPLQRRLQRRVGGRGTQAALLTLAVVLLIAVLPLVLVGVGLVNEVTALYAEVQSGQIRPETWVRQVLDSLPAPLTRLLERFGVLDVQAVQSQLGGLFNRAGQALATGLLRYGQNTFEWVASLFIMLYVAFFLLRDGAALMATLRDSVPLAPTHQRALLRKFSTVIRATVKGNLLVALLQGCLGGLAFWVLGIRGALLWTALMAFLSLLPAVGAALVWGPVAIYLLAEGRMAAGLGLVAWGVLVIGLVDNLLRPVLVGKDTRLPDWVVLLATLGGMAVFGLNGFVIGPVIVAMFLAVWHIMLLDWRGQSPDEEEPPRPRAGP